MTSPNLEQIRAIEHTGGMILNAGAGSGKTFVLVKHFIHLTENFLEEKKTLSGERLSKELAKFFSKMVFMTYTRKAAGELSGRIREAISERSKDPRWELAENQVSHLYVGTIHGFCTKLLSQGYVTEIGPELNILTEAEQAEKIHSLVRDFYERVGNKLPIADLLVANLDQIAEGFIFIFNSVELRSKWKEWDIRKTSNLEFQLFMEEVFKVNNWELLNQYHPSDFAEFSEKSWGKNIIGFLDLLHQIKFRDISVLKDYLQFFSGIKKLMKPKENPSGFEVISKMGELRDFLKKREEELVAFFENPKLVEGWAKTVKSLFDFMENQIPYHKGLVFSDLEYYVLKGLKTPSLAKRVRDNYSYFVVDEFQDTSRGQSEIFELLIDKKPEKLFCVGDLKQAIYGFRGGDLDVFLEFMEKMPLKEELKSNYRSREKLIQFNNKFFDHVFNSSFDFSSPQNSVIPISHQIFPIDSKSVGLGEINRLKLNIEDAELSDINRVEAFGVLDLIKQIKINHPEEEICVLYRNRDPSMNLIVELLSERLEFKAQVKVPQNSDPIIGIFKALLEAQIFFESGKSYFPQFEILMSSYLDYLSILMPKNLSQLFEQFIKDQKTIGMMEGARKFFFGLNICNSNYANNISNLKSIVDLSNGNPEEVLNFLNLNQDAGYTFEFQMGKGKNLIKIMTIHASKGLEFDHVILGGIHNNEGGGGGASPLFGNVPGSFLWKKESKDKKSFKTPQYYLEDKYTHIKESLESKRLLYVAVTRAKNSLSFVDIDEVIKGPRSWINAFRFFEDRDNLIKTFEKTQFLSEVSLKGMKRPLFHRDDLGIILKEDCDGPSFLGTLGDISVTSLAPLSECPRKFYLKNVCRLDDDSFAQQYDEEETPVLSSSERGSKIHFEISRRLIQKDFSTHPDSPIQFALNHLGKLKDDYEIISEKLFKFPVFGYMCSGIPDVLLLPLKDSPFLILDFKTGAKNEISHLFQLYVYAYGAYQLGMLDKEKEIKVILLYLDLKEVVEVTIDFQKTTQEVFKVWRNLYNLDQVNLNHCKECAFHGLCYSFVATP
jgi:ATP-dependent helicase/nuclease subunit A